MKYLISFSTTINDIEYMDTELRQLRLERSAYQYAGIDKHHHWTRGKLKRTSFYRENKEVLDLKQGAGYYLWKPYIIYDALKRAETGDWILYCDNSFYFVQDAGILYELAERNNGFGLYCYDRAYQIQHVMQPVTRKKLGITDDLLQQPVTVGGFMMFRKNEDTMRFVGEWLELCLDAELLVDQKEPCPPEIKHRYDMPLLSYLRAVWNIEAFRLPHQSGDKNKMPAFRTPQDALVNGDDYDNIFENSPYGTLCIWDKEGINCPRPWSHYLDPVKVLSFVRRKMARGN